jgi:hypothetical protein
MKIRRAAIAAASGVVATALLSVVPVGAQDLPLLPISVSPGSGPAGTVVTVSGDGCIGEEGPGDIAVFLFDATSDEPIDAFQGSVAGDGAWTFALPFEASDPLGVYDFTALCFASPDLEAPVIAEYDFASFELTAPAPAPAPTPDPAPQTPVVPAPQAPVAPAATPAAAVRAQPTFTG